VHLVGFTIGIYYDAWTYECQSYNTSLGTGCVFSWEIRTSSGSLPETSGQKKSK